MPRKSDHIIDRNGTFYYYRRVPVEYAEIDKRRFVMKTLKTDSEETARKRAALVDKAQLESWETQLAVGHSDDQQARYDAAVRLARTHGFQYLPVDELKDRSLEELVRRMNEITRQGDDNKAIVAALAGGVEKPRITIADALDLFYDYSRDATRAKTDDELRRWKNPRKKAVANFISQFGNVFIDEITRDMALDFRGWWLSRIEEEDLTANAANKDIGALSKLVRTVSDAKRLGLANPFERLLLSEADDASTKTSFDPTFAQQLLSGDKLHGLSDDLRFLLLAMADTGAGFKELTGLDPENGDIRIDAAVPYIHIRRNNIRGLKNRHRERQIPLVGTSLAAFLAFPKGFEAYRGRSASASTAANKYLRENHLLPTEDHGANSFRHTFEDRLTAIEPPDKIIAVLMGHKYHRERYGKPPSLSQKQKWMAKIAFGF